MPLELEEDDVDSGDAEELDESVTDADDSLLALLEELEDEDSSAKPRVGTDAASIAAAAKAARGRFIERGKGEKDEDTLSGRLERRVAPFDVLMLHRKHGASCMIRPHARALLDEQRHAPRG